MSEKQDSEVPNFIEAGQPDGKSNRFTRFKNIVTNTA
jgi:hypothetical protein